MAFMMVNGCRLYYTVQGQGTPILFIHPPVLTHFNFKYQMEELSKYFKVITFDIRGHGRSSFSRQPLTYPLIVEDMKQLLDHLDIQKAFICGYSTGGPIALEFLLTKPNRAWGGIVISGISEVSDWVLKNRIALGIALAKSKALSTPGLINIMDQYEYQIFILENGEGRENGKSSKYLKNIIDIACPIIVQASWEKSNIRFY